jgi:hypothetical protein
MEESNPSEREWRAGLNLIWLVHGGFWAKIWCPKMLHFFVFGENQRELFSVKISAPAYLYLT